MEYVDGERLDRWCDAHALALRARIELFIKICAAVEYAHGRLVIHRDLKPANILVNRDGEPKLLDFGIARLLDAEIGGNATTVLNAMTMAYASPEQVRGETLGTATDIWSLGVVLYELVAGVRPFDHLASSTSAPTRSSPARSRRRAAARARNPRARTRRAHRRACATHSRRRRRDRAQGVAPRTRSTLRERRRIRRRSAPFPRRAAGACASRPVDVSHATILLAQPLAARRRVRAVHRCRRVHLAHRACRTRSAQPGGNRRSRHRLPHFDLRGERFNLNTTMRHDLTAREVLDAGTARIERTRQRTARARACSNRSAMRIGT
jgi:serine/threonine-protein kinase